MRFDRRWLRWILPFAFWSVPAALIITVSLHENPERSFARTFITQGLPWYYWALVTHPILALARRFPLESLKRVRGIAVHLGAGLLTGFVCGVLSGLLVLAFGPEMTEGQTPARVVIQGAIFWTVFGVLFYTTIASVGFALGYQATLREREVAATRLEAKLVEAQLGALRMQLQPHFLFNTLNAVAMYVREGDQSTAVRLLARLSEMLRHLLDDGGAQEVPLATELEHARRYLEIESVRFSDRLRVQYDVPSDLLDALVPNLLLQPLIENAVRHGIATRANASVIEVSARREAGQVQMVVRNEGPALENGWCLDDAAGIGLRNTTLRLAHLYGADARLELENWSGGVQARIELPYHTQPVSAQHG